MSTRRKQIGTLGIAILALALAVPLAGAELTARGDLFVKFSGGIVPEALPRDARAPVAVTVAGTVKTLSGKRPPALRGITIALNRGGRLDARGLPRCRQSQLEPGSTAEALAACRPALVGSGSFAADVAFPEQRAFLSHGRIVAFNAVVAGHRAILAHAYSPEPVPITRIIVFHIHQSSGTYRTVLTGRLPEAKNRWGYLRRISLELHREFIYRGTRHSYLSASCAAPGAFPGAVFPFARASMSFADGRTLSSTLTRSCKVLEAP